MTKRTWWLLASVLGALAGCYYMVYEPTVCRKEDVDTLGVVLDEQNNVTGYIIARTCTLWQAYSDSTKCWDMEGERTPCAP